MLFRSTLPIWEDLLMFNENYNYFIQKKPKVMLFFEVSVYCRRTWKNYFRA